LCIITQKFMNITSLRRSHTRYLGAAFLGALCGLAPLDNTAQAATGSKYCGSGTAYYGSAGKGPKYKLTFTGVTLPGNPSLGVNQYKEYKVWANAYYQWYYIGKELHAC
jgi:hypothetical protein